MKELETRFLALLILLSLLTFLSCHKENGKHKYLFTAKFIGYDSEVNLQCYIFEKPKDYGITWSPTRVQLLNNKQIAYVRNEESLQLEIDKSHNRKTGSFELYGSAVLTDKEFPINDIPENDTNRFYVTFSCRGDFKRKGRELIIISQTCKMYWYENSTAYGYPLTDFKGKFSLLRQD